MTKDTAIGQTRRLERSISRIESHIMQIWHSLDALPPHDFCAERAGLQADLGDSRSRMRDHREHLVQVYSLLASAPDSADQRWHA